MKLKLLILVLLLLVNYTVLAEDSVVSTGADLLRVCENGMVKGKNIEEATDTIVPFGICYNYIVGFWQSYLEQLKNIYNVDSPEKIADKNIRKRMFCVKNGTNSCRTNIIMSPIYPD